MLQKLLLRNYRNLSNLELELGHGNLLIAPNGSGKSNLLESIYVTNFLRSFRSLESWRDLLGPELDFCKITQKWDDGELQAIISYQSEKMQRNFEWQGAKHKLIDFLGKHKMVLFAPTTVDLVAGEPALRRGDLDDYLSSLSSEYLEALHRYQVTLKNRNALLQILAAGRTAGSEMELYSQQLASSGAQLYSKRKEFFTEMSARLAEYSQKLLRKDEPVISLRYISNFIPDQDYAGELLQKYQQNLTKETIVGRTLYGPHKDDYQFMLGERPLRFIGSRGQQRIGGLLYKLIQLDFLKRADSNGNGLLLLDDLMSELDQGHREACAQLLMDYGSEYQLIFTAANHSDVPEKLHQRLEIINL